MEETNEEIKWDDFEWCSLAECYVDKEDCVRKGCEKCKFYLES